MNLKDTWVEREKKWQEGSALIVKGNLAWKEISNMPGNTRIMVWLAISEASFEAAAQVAKGYQIRLEADLLWGDAVIAALGPTVKATWDYVPEKKSYRCTLSNGEVFEP